MQQDADTHTLHNSSLSSYGCRTLKYWIQYRHSIYVCIYLYAHMEDCPCIYVYMAYLPPAAWKTQASLPVLTQPLISVRTWLSTILNSISLVLGSITWSEVECSFFSCSRCACVVWCVCVCVCVCMCVCVCEFLRVNVPIRRKGRDITHTIAHMYDTRNTTYTYSTPHQTNSETLVYVRVSLPCRSVV